MAKHPAIYLDYAASTPIRTEVLEAMQPYLTSSYGNPSSLHSLGRQASEAVERARELCASALGCTPEEIVFTGSGTESDYLALIGVATANSDKRQVITSQIEHPALLGAAEELQDCGFEVTYLPVDKYGFVSPDQLKKHLTHKTSIVSIMHANNEIGTVQPIEELARLAREAGALFHTDACQTAGWLPLDIKNIDLATLNASKIYGPKGVGLLYLKNGTVIKPIMRGGGQEYGLRGGTENVAGIVGLSVALELAVQEHQDTKTRLTTLSDVLMKGLLVLPGTELVGHPTTRLPSIVTLRFPGIDAQNLIQALDDQSIYVSAGSACSAADPDPSHVLLAIGMPYNQTFECVRFSLGKNTTMEEVHRSIKAVTNIATSTRT